MRNIIKTLLLSAFIFISCGGDDDGSPASGGGGVDGGDLTGTASYTLTFETEFTEDSYPNDYPSNPTFGPILVITHSPEVSVFEIGQLASAGFKAYVEDGDVGALAAFLSDELGEANEGLFIISTTPAIGASASTTIDVTATESRTRITFLARLDPSPDWFVGVNSFDIIDGNELVESATVNLAPLDAGTATGDTYEASTGVENANISTYQGLPFADGPFVGTLATLSIERDE